MCSGHSRSRVRALKVHHRSSKPSLSLTQTDSFLQATKRDVGAGTQDQSKLQVEATSLAPCQRSAFLKRSRIDCCERRKRRTKLSLTSLHHQHNAAHDRDDGTRPHDRRVAKARSRYMIYHKRDSSEPLTLAFFLHLILLFLHLPTHTIEMPDRKTRSKIKLQEDLSAEISSSPPAASEP